MSIKSLAKHLQPRERFMQVGEDSLTDAELLALILGSGSGKVNVLELSQLVLSSYSIHDLRRVSIQEIAKIPGIGLVTAMKIKASLTLASRAKRPTRTYLKSAKDVFNHLLYLQTKDREHVVALFLNKKKQILHQEILSIGTLDQTIMHPRDLFKRGVQYGAYAIIIAHNHPTGDPKPSHADIEITNYISETSEFLGMPLLDHVIIGDTYYSFLEDGKLTNHFA